MAGRVFEFTHTGGLMIKDSAEEDWWEAQMTPTTKAPSAQFEISVGKLRTYRDRKAVAIEAAEYLRRKHPNSEVVVKDLRSGEGAEIKYKSEFGRDARNDETKALGDATREEIVRPRPDLMKVRVWRL
jgi:hypothetical protein